MGNSTAIDWKENVLQEWRKEWRKERNGKLRKKCLSQAFRMTLFVKSPSYPWMKLKESKQTSSKGRFLAVES